MRRPVVNYRVREKLFCSAPEESFGSLGDFRPQQWNRPLPRARRSSYVGFFGWSADASGHNVLVNFEDVVGIVLAFDIHESVVVTAVIRPNSFVVVIVHEVDVPADLRMGRYRIGVVAHPLCVCLLYTSPSPRDS